jgi:hypothetical protein
MLCRSSFLSENMKMESYSGSRRAPAYHSKRVYRDRTVDILLRTSVSFVTSSFGPIRTIEPKAVSTQNHFPLRRYIYSTDHISRMLPPCLHGSGPPGISSPAGEWRSRDVAQTHPPANPVDDRIRNQKHQQDPGPGGCESCGDTREDHVWW